MPKGEDARDVVQEACLRAYRSFATFRGDNGRAWLLAIVRNACFTQLAKTRMQGSQQAFEGDVEQTALEPLPGWAATATDPLTLLEQRTEIELVKQLIRSLPYDYREVLVLREVEELTYKEIANMLSVPIGTVMSRLARARAVLERKLTAHFPEVPKP
jgi:RNA polymerase sigma-70 factor (ECF subfamily)